VIFPCQRNGALTVAIVLDVPFEVLDRRRRLAHMHLCFTQILRWVVSQAPLPRLLVEDQRPVVCIGNIHKEGIVALRNVHIADHQVAIRV